MSFLVETESGKMKGMFSHQHQSGKAVVIRDASTIQLDSETVDSNQPDSGNADAQHQMDDSASSPGDDVAQVQAFPGDPEADLIGIYVDFSTLESVLGEWHPSNPDMARAEIASELVSLLKSKGIRAQTGRGPDLLVCDRYPVDFEKGSQPIDVDRLLEKMIWDSQVYGCVIGLAYGVEDNLIVEQLECILEEFFEKEDMVTVVLC
jgi:hypothetical protein